MILGNTLWLWLMAAAIVPISIHLWNRKSGEPQLLGTFRFLPDQSFAKARRIELHEIPLLLLRIILTFLIVFLLTDLLIEKEQPGIESVIISETNSSDWSEQYREGVVEIQIPTSQIENSGWWNIIEQADADYQPTMIHVNGRLSQHLFLGNRPSLAASVTWKNSESETEFISSIWQSGEERYSTLIQQADSIGVYHSIENFSNPEIINSQAIVRGDTVAYAGTLRVIINSEIPQQIQNGLEFAGNYWNASIEYSEIPESTLLTIITNDQEFNLLQITQPDGVVDMIEASPQTGVNVEISNLDSASVNHSETLLTTEINRIPVFGFEDDQTAFVNGKIASNLTSWFYAGTAHKLIQKSLGVNHFLSPEMSEEQKEVRKTQHQTAGIFVNESLRIWLFLLLLIVWSVERFLAPRRGM